jgi:hypothetical protein
MNSVYANLTPYKGSKHILIYNQSVGDIMQGILATHNLHRAEYDKISRSFRKATPYKTGKAIFDFLKSNTHYVVESDNKQTLRSPSAILYLGSNPKIGLDCKSYSLFIGGILDSLNRSGANINWTYRFASYKPFDKLPHHVFVVINPNTSNEIWVDPVLPSFNLHKSYHYKIDSKPMALIAMAGIGRISKKQAIKKIKDKLKKGGKILIKFNPATASARNAFLLLLKLNVFNLGRKLYALQKKNPQKLKSFWEKIGGNYRTLSVNIGLGAKQQPQLSGIGFAPVVAGAIATATPIILKFKSLLNEMGIKDEQINKIGKALIKKAKDKAIDKLASADSEPSTEITPDPPNFANNEEVSNLEASSENSSDTSSEDSSDTMDGVMVTKQYSKRPKRRYPKPMMYNNIRKPQIGTFA